MKEAISSSALRQVADYWTGQQLLRSKDNVLFMQRQYFTIVVLSELMPTASFTNSMKQSKLTADQVQIVAASTYLLEQLLPYCYC